MWLASLEVWEEDTEPMNEELMESPVLPNGGSGDSIIIPTPNKSLL
jgi:hypothetical protein